VTDADDVADSIAVDCLDVELRRVRRPGQLSDLALELARVQLRDRLRRLAAQLALLKESGQEAVDAYVRTVKLALFSRAKRMIAQVKL